MMIIFIWLFNSCFQLARIENYSPEKSLLEFNNKTKIL